MKRLVIILGILLLVSGCSSDSFNGEVNVLNWSSYIPNEIINDFEREYNIKVNYGTYSSNEELLAKISLSKEGTYDLIFPSDYMIELMIERDMLDEFDISKIENAKNLSNVFLKQSFDPNNEYSLPFLSATTVIAVNTKNIKDNIYSYDSLLDSKYKNDIVLLDDQRIVIGMALLATGHDMNDKSIDALNEAKEWLLKVKKNVKAFDSDSPKNFLITGETNIGVIWNAEAVLAKAVNPDIKIIYPVEGHAISLDNYAIVKGAKNKDNAYKFINYLLDYEVSDKIVDSYPYINPNNEYKMYSYNEISTIINTGHYVKNIGPSIVDYDIVWAEIK